MTMITDDPPLRCQIHDLLTEASEMLGQGRPDCAAWRVADAGLLLRDLLERRAGGSIVGLDTVSGRGARLPRREVCDE